MNMSEDALGRKQMPEEDVSAGWDQNTLFINTEVDLIQVPEEMHMPTKELEKDAGQKLKVTGLTW